MLRATVALGVLLIFSRVAIIFCSPVAICPGSCSHPEMTSSWNPAERTSADYHAGGLTIVIFGEEYWQFPCRSGRVKFLRREGHGRRGYENRIKSGELSLRFGVTFSALVTNYEHAQKIHSLKPGAGRNCFCGRNAKGRLTGQWQKQVRKS